ncbi:MAG: DUF3786 domain-containing protein [Thermodesulfobacteriota bacterium]|nr:DUF3786 domain-containing protein [Thermodesulfobacteriota bacterium]
MEVMGDNYAKIVRDNLKRLYENCPENLARVLPSERDGDSFLFDAFGEKCELRPDGIFLDAVQQTGVIGILISLYALHARPKPSMLEPLKAFKDFPNSMPYARAFVTHTQQILVPHVDKIQKARDQLMANLLGCNAPASVKGDFSFIVYPLPKIALCYIFYDADDDFSASVTCLYSNNALSFLPIDALADVGEYTSRKMLDLIH